MLIAEFIWIPLDAMDLAEYFTGLAVAVALSFYATRRSHRPQAWSWVGIGLVIAGILSKPFDGPVLTPVIAGIVLFAMADRRERRMHLEREG